MPFVADLGPSRNGGWLQKQKPPEILVQLNFHRVQPSVTTLLPERDAASTAKFKESVSEPSRMLAGTLDFWCSDVKLLHSLQVHACTSRLG